MKKYAFSPVIPPEVAESLKAYPPLVQELLYSRGINNSSDADKFINPDYERDTHDPFLIKGMEKAVSRIIKAIKENEKIIIWSDYDADGIPGGVVFHDFFTRIKFSNFENYIPHRQDEGFGLNKEAIRELAADGAKLLVTVDCGIVNVSEVELANELGVEVIITDHHEPGEVLPPAVSILDVKQKDDSYPFKHLCGAGVAFKFIQGILLRERFGLKDGIEKWFLDMVGLATLSDMVPLSGENRVFAFYGLKVLRKSPRTGLLQLAKKLRLNMTYLVEDDIGFTISPRINAASRMGIPMDAFRLLSTCDPLEAGSCVDHLERINNERKGHVASIVKDARKKIVSRGGQDGMDKVIVLGNPEWRPALLGLVANNLVADHRRPVFIWGREGGKNIKGSCRSSGEVSVVEIMSCAKELFLEFGGHRMSGGFSVSHDKVHMLEDGLSRAYEKVLSDSSEIIPERIDKRLSLDDVSWENYNQLEKLSPFGTGNSKPLFIFQNVSPVQVKIFGKEGNHLELIFKNSRGGKIPAIAFFAGPESFGKKIEEGKSFDLVATMEKSVFRGSPELRLRVVDVV